MSNFKKLTALLLALLLLLSLTACGDEDGRPVIAVSIPPEADFVRAVAGEEFRIVTMVPPGYSPEAYEPTVRAMMDFADAEIFFSIGVPVETTALLPALDDGTRHVSLAEAARTQYADLMIGEERDPHIWLSPSRVSLMIEAIVTALSERAPENATLYRQNADVYLASLLAADAAVRAALSASDVSEFIVYHPAFGYLAEEYELTMHALEEHGGEVTPGRLAAMVDLARDRGIKVIFYQAETDSREAEAFAEEIGGRAVMLSPLSENYIENLTVMAEAIATAAGEESAP